MKVSVTSPFLPIRHLHHVAASIVAVVVVLIQLQRRAREQLVVEHDFLLLPHRIRLDVIQRRARHLHARFEHIDRIFSPNYTTWAAIDTTEDRE